MTVVGTYTYRGDRMTDPALRGASCVAVRRADGRCITGRGAMLVLFAGEENARVVLRRQLRKAVAMQAPPGGEHVKHQPNAKRMKRTPAGVVDVTPVVPVAKWGRDHWTTLLYVESRCVDCEGMIDNQRMRTNARVHRKLLGAAQVSAGVSGMDYPTQLRNGDTLDRHDDWSCLEDAVAHGLLVVRERDRTPGRPFGGGEVVAQLTDLGWRVAHAIRRDRGRGTPTVQWQPLPELEAEIRGAFLEAEALHARQGKGT